MADTLFNTSFESLPETHRLLPLHSLHSLHSCTQNGTLVLAGSHTILGFSVGSHTILGFAGTHTILGFSVGSHTILGFSVGSHTIFYEKIGWKILKWNSGEKKYDHGSVLVFNFKFFSPFINKIIPPHRGGGGGVIMLIMLPWLRL